MKLGSGQQRILIIGAAGQIGVELTIALRERYGAQSVIASDIAAEPALLAGGGPWETIDATSEADVYSKVVRLGITQVYLLAAMLSATGEGDPQKAWRLNMNSLLNVLDIAKEEKLKVFWPSSIAAAAPGSTVYGISKYAGELWCQYYFEKYGVDVRSLRYPGLISYKTAPGGGTTDYAVEIFHAALEQRTYACFLREDTMLPMMYMPDAVRATMLLMDALKTNISNRMSYDIAGMSFTPGELAKAIKGFCPAFDIVYQPDHRQRIADSWPQSIGDLESREDWGWKPAYSLNMMVKEMLVNLDTLRTKKIIDKLETAGVL